MWFLRMSHREKMIVIDIFVVYVCIQGLHERLKHRSTDITMVIAIDVH